MGRMMAIRRDSRKKGKSRTKKLAVGADYKYVPTTPKSARARAPISPEPADADTQQPNPIITSPNQTPSWADSTSSPTEPALLSQDEPIQVTKSTVRGANNLTNETSTYIAVPSTSKSTAPGIYYSGGKGANATKSSSSSDAALEEIGSKLDVTLTKLKSSKLETLKAQLLKTSSASSSKVRKSTDLKIVPVSPPAQLSCQLPPVTAENDAEGVISDSKRPKRKYKSRQSSAAVKRKMMNECPRSEKSPDKFLLDGAQDNHDLLAQEMFRNFQRLTKLFPDWSPTTIQNLLVKCQGDLTKSIDNVFYFKSLNINISPRNKNLPHTDRQQMLPNSQNYKTQQQIVPSPQSTLLFPPWKNLPLPADNLPKQFSAQYDPNNQFVQPNANQFNQPAPRSQLVPNLNRQQIQDVKLMQQQQQQQQQQSREQNAQIIRQMGLSQQRSPLTYETIGHVAKNKHNVMNNIDYNRTEFDGGRMQSSGMMSRGTMPPAMMLTRMAPSGTMTAGMMRSGTKPSGGLSSGLPLLPLTEMQDSTLGMFADESDIYPNNTQYNNMTSDFNQYGPPATLLESHRTLLRLQQQQQQKRLQDQRYQQQQQFQQQLQQQQQKLQQQKLLQQQRQQMQQQQHRQQQKLQQQLQQQQHKQQQHQQRLQMLRQLEAMQKDNALCDSSQVFMGNPREENSINSLSRVQNNTGNEKILETEFEVGNVLLYEEVIDQIVPFEADDVQAMMPGLPPLSDAIDDGDFALNMDLAIDLDQFNKEDEKEEQTAEDLSGISWDSTVLFTSSGSLATGTRAVTVTEQLPFPIMVDDEVIITTFED